MKIQRHTSLMLLLPTTFSFNTFLAVRNQNDMVFYSHGFSFSWTTSCPVNKGFCLSGHDDRPTQFFISVHLCPCPEIAWTAHGFDFPSVLLDFWSRLLTFLSDQASGVDSKTRKGQIYRTASTFTLLGFDK